MIESEDIILELRNIKKSFDENQVLSGINISIKRGEFITLLGSSGCGKTTTLRMISGLDVPDSGSIILEGMDVTDLPPEKRDVNTVFQNYALFPHMNVFDNVAYGLKLKKVPKNEIRSRVKNMLDMVKLSGFEKRYPSEMSGGQMQRVAIARALVNNPKLLLLDEPLGALDLQLRRQMQHELKRLQKKLGITFVYITHDQEEAINMSDRIAVMRDGEFIQIGSPSDIYERPETSYVAKFVGSSNILNGEVCSLDGDIVKLKSEDGIILTRRDEHDIKIGEHHTVAVRGEYIQISKEEKPDSIRGKVVEKTYVGGLLRISIALKNGEIEVSRNGINFDVAVDDEIYLYWDYRNSLLVDLEAR